MKLARAKARGLCGGEEWTDTNLLDRMKDVGFKDRDYFDYCIKLTYAYSHINATSLIWGEVYDDPRLSNQKFTPEAIYGVTAQMLGHVIKALNCKFTDHFTEYNDIWNQIKVDKDIRTKMEKVKNTFDKNIVT